MARVLDIGRVSDCLWTMPFVWPLLAWLLRRKCRRYAAQVAINMVEALCAIASLVWLIQIVALYGHIRYGGVLASGAYVAYVVVAMANLLTAYRQRYGVGSVATPNG